MGAHKCIVRRTPFIQITEICKNNIELAIGISDSMLQVLSGHLDSYFALKSLHPEKVFFFRAHFDG
jgi:hypothetical protein